MSINLFLGDSLGLYSNNLNLFFRRLLLLKLNTLFAISFHKHILSLFLFNFIYVSNACKCLHYILQSHSLSNRVNKFHSIYHCGVFLGMFENGCLRWLILCCTTTKVYSPNKKVSPNALVACECLSV